MTTRNSNCTCALLAFLWLIAQPAHAGQYSLSAAGTISSNSSGAASIPVGTPWSFELVYDTTAPDLDFELTGSVEPTFGRFTNTGTPPALKSFHYKAGSYEVTLDDPADFATGSNVLITFTSIHAIDINVNAPSLFPQLAGGPVSFHADFNAFSMAPVLANDGLPTSTALSPTSFDQSTVSLLPASGVISSSTITSFTVAAVPEPSAIALVVAVLTAGSVATRNTSCRQL